MTSSRQYFPTKQKRQKAVYEAGITVTLPKPMTSGAKAAGRFGKQDFIYVDTQDVYICPAGPRR